MANILQISEALALAIHACAIIGGSENKCSAGQIATLLNASHAHLSKVMRQLVVADLVSSERGPGGGFALAKEAKKITLLDIYQVIEGKFPTSGCLFNKPVCREQCCIIGDFLRDINQRTYHYLASTTLDDILRNQSEEKEK